MTRRHSVAVSADVVKINALTDRAAAFGERAEIQTGDTISKSIDFDHVQASHVLLTKTTPAINFSSY